MIKEPPEWKKRALADVHLSDRHWSLLQLGPNSLAKAFIMQALKFKYMRSK